jgi:hypothetical protein
MSKVIAALLMSVLGGCATVPFNPPPPGILVAPPVIAASEPFATVYVFRDASFTGAATQNWISLNKDLVASLGIRERIELRLPLGRHEVGVHCFAWGKWREQTKVIEATANQSYFFLLSASLSESLQMDELSSAQSHAWLRKTKLETLGPR